LDQKISPVWVSPRTTYKLHQLHQFAPLEETRDQICSAGIRRFH